LEASLLTDTAKNEIWFLPGKEKFKMCRLSQLSIIFGLFVAFAAPIASADDSEQTVYTYNDSGQVVLATYSNGASVTYTYDANGNVATVVQVVDPVDPNAAQPSN
jgi:YD repeat-containing protein